MDAPCDDVLVLLFAPILDALQGFLSALVATECGEADIAFAAGPEADSRCTDHLCSIQQGFEELPRAHAIGRSHPDVGCVLAAIAFEAETSQDAEHMGSVLHIVVDDLLHLLSSLWRVDGLGRALTDVAGAVELGALSA